MFSTPRLCRSWHGGSTRGAPALILANHSCAISVGAVCGQFERSP